MPADIKSRKWLFYFVPILVVFLITAFLFVVPSTRKSIVDWITNSIFGTSQKEAVYNPEKDKEIIKEITLGFYHAYQELSPGKIIALTKEPLSTWEISHCENLKKQDANYKQPEIKPSDLGFEFKDITNSAAEIVVKRLNVLEVAMPFKFGETTQGDMSFQLRKDNTWKITNRTYNNLWVSEVY